MKNSKKGFSNIYILIIVIIVIVVALILGGISFYINATKELTVEEASKIPLYPPCENLKISDEKITEATNSSIDELYNAGQTNPWGDPAQFEELLNLIEEKLRCSLDKNEYPSLKN